MANRKPNSASEIRDADERAQAEAGSDGAGEAAAFEVVDGARLGLELRTVKVGRALQHIAQREPAFTQGVAALALFGADVFFRHRQADALRKIAHGLDKTQAQVFGEKAKCVAAGAAAEAVIKLLRRAD